MSILRQHRLVHRDLHPRERAALNALRTAEFAGVAELRAQADTASAVGEALVVDLVVDLSLPAAIVGHRIPVQAAVDGEGYDGGLILYVDDGRLSGLEYWWVTEEALRQLSCVGGVQGQSGHEVAAFSVAGVVADVRAGVVACLP